VFGSEFFSDASAEYESKKRSGRSTSEGYRYGQDGGRSSPPERMGNESCNCF
jgi:hypothetical protein